MVIDVQWDLNPCATTATLSYQVSSNLEGCGETRQEPSIPGLTEGRYEINNLQLGSTYNFRLEIISIDANQASIVINDTVTLAAGM